jgi:hypothetical protein
MGILASAWVRASTEAAFATLVALYGNRRAAPSRGSR